MQLLLNELSVHNQFHSFEHFQNGALIEIINFLDLQRNGKAIILKKSDIYSTCIYDGKTLHEILLSKGKEGKSDEIRKLKVQLASIINNPFWDNEQLCSNNNTYMYGKTLVNNSALAEGFERESCIISLNPSNFMVKNLLIHKDTLSKIIFNYFTFKSFIEKLYVDRRIDFEFFCKNYFKDTKLNFTKVDSSESFNYISKQSDEDEFLGSFKMFSKLTWNDILQQGGKGKNKAGLAFTKFHDQNYFSNYHPESLVHKFRVSQKYRVFGYRIKDTFFVLEFDLTHRLSD